MKNLLNKITQLISFILLVIKKGTDDQITAYAAQTAFFILMSVFPFSIFLLQMMRFAPISQESLLVLVDSLFPEYLLPTLHEILQEIYSSTPGLVAVTIVTTLWASSNALFALATGLDRVVAAEGRRNAIVTRIWALVYTFAFAILAVLAVASTVWWQSVRVLLFHYRPRGISLAAYSSAIRSAYSIVLLSLVFTLMYKFFPHKKLRFLKQIPGAIVASVGWYLSSVFMAFYVAHFDAVSMFGSLTTLALVMFWLYLCNFLIMLGAEINEALRLKSENA